MKSAVHGIYCVNSPHAGRDGICTLIAPVALHGFLFLGYADVAVSIYKSGVHIQPRRIKNFCICRWLHSFSNAFDFSIIYQQISLYWSIFLHSIKQSVFY